MKNLQHDNTTTRYRTVLLVFILLLSRGDGLWCQEFRDTTCATEIPVGWYEEYVKEVPLIEEYAKMEKQGENRTLVARKIPVRFTEFLNDAGTNAHFTHPLNDAFVSLYINKNNTAFGSTQFEFVRAGKPINIRSSKIANNDNKFHFAYVTSDVNWIMLPGSGRSNASLPPPALLGMNPLIQIFGINNTGTMYHDRYTAITHETGHHFGLIHTFGIPVSYSNISPLPVTVLDYPFTADEVAVGANSNPRMLSYDWRGRELVIRENTSGKIFENINWVSGGDLLKDTPPDCEITSNNWSSRFPGCPSSHPDYNTCIFAGFSSPIYSDYNGDAVFPQNPDLLPIQKNFMSYWGCSEDVRHFTPDQLTRAQYYFDTYRQYQYGNASCVENFDAMVLNEGTVHGIRNVMVRTRHPITNNSSTFLTKVSNATTDYQGNFSGRLYDSKVKAYLWAMGSSNDLINVSKKTYVFPTGHSLPSLVHYVDDETLTRDTSTHFPYLPSDWLLHVTTDDAYRIYQHLLGQNPITDPYDVIAADVRKNNYISPLDHVEITLLLLDSTTSFFGHQQPWRFMPEYIPQVYSAAFQANPFQISQGGGAKYLEPGWQYRLHIGDNCAADTNYRSRKKGFRGTKIGDVDDSMFNDPQYNGAPVNIPPSSTLKGDAGASEGVRKIGDVVEIEVRANQFKDMLTLQFALAINTDVLEVIEVLDYPNLPYFESRLNSRLIQKNGKQEIRSSWFTGDFTPKSLEDGDAFFRIRAIVKDVQKPIYYAFSMDTTNIANFVRFSDTVKKHEPSFTFVEVQSLESRNYSKKLENFQVTVYPNPTAEVSPTLNIYSTTGSSIQIRVIDLYGRTQSEFELSTQKGFQTTTLQGFSELPRGMYRILVTNKEGSKTISLIKSN